MALVGALGARRGGAELDSDDRRHALRHPLSVAPALPPQPPQAAIVVTGKALPEPKGELVVLVGPGADVASTPQDADRALAEALTRLGPGEAASEVARALGLPRRDLYRRALDLQGRA